MTSSLLRHLIPLFATSTIAGLVLAILAPLGTHNFSLPLRLTYWVGLCLAGGLGAGIADAGIKRVWPKLNVWVSALGQSLGATAMVAIFIFSMDPPTTLKIAGMTLFYIWVVAMTISGVGALLTLAKADKSVTVNEARAALIERLPPKFRRSEIYAITAEDHYVRVMTSTGDTMILMRLSDAILEVSPLPGVQVHRSWWVSEIGIASVEKEGSKRSVHLKNGTVVPVSRSGNTTIKEAGWV